VHLRKNKKTKKQNNPQKTKKTPTLEAFHSGRKFQLKKLKG